MALTREQVVRTAVGLLDQVGLEALTLRRLATELGVSAATIYWHVKDKRELLDLMAEALVASTGRTGSPAPGQPWWQWLAEHARLQWRALVVHRDAALVVAGNRPTESTLPLLERVIGSLVAAGFPPEEALRIILTLSHYVIGCALEYQAEAARAGDAQRDGWLAARLEQADDLPHLGAAIAAHRQRPHHPHPDPGGAFEHGLGLLIDGIRARHAELAAVPVRAES